MPDYIVTLPMQVEADTPADAIEAFMQQALAFGLRGWNFNVYELGESGDVEGGGIILRGTGEAAHGDTEAESTPTEGEPADAGSPPASEGGDD